jgi:hypothetical protein
MKDWDVHFVTEHHGFVTVEAASVEEAVEKFKEWHLDDYSKFSDPRKTRVYEVTDENGENGVKINGVEWEE